MFSGGSQFALIGVIAAGGVAAGPAAIGASALLGARNTLYSIRMSPIVGPGWLRRVLAGWITIDESTAVATAQPTLRSQRIGFWMTGLLIFVGWNLTTLLGTQTFASGHTVVVDARLPALALAAVFFALRVPFIVVLVAAAASAAVLRMVCPNL